MGDTFNVLNGYLFQHKSISVPGLGTIYLDAVPAEMDASGKYMLPPAYHFRFDKYFDAPDKDFFTHLASERNIPDYEAIKWYNEFSYELRNKIRHDDKAEWEGVGVLKKDNEGNIVFESTAQTPPFLRPVLVRFGEHNGMEPLPGASQQDTPGESSYPQEPAAAKNNWWIYALIATAIALIILLFHFSSTGFRPEATGNQQSLEFSR